MEKNTVNDNILNDTIFGITFNFASIDNIFSPKKNKVFKRNAVSQKKIPSARFWQCSAYNIENQSPAGDFFNDSIFDDDNIFLVNFGKYRQCQKFTEKISSMPFYVQMSENTVNAQVQSHFVVQDVLTVSILSYLAPLEPFSPGDLTALRIYSGRTLKKLITCNNVSNLLLVAHLLLPAFQY